MKGKKQKHNKDDSNDGSSLIDLIPMDLTMEILTRLPVQSLLRFQYVSKIWFSIIRSKDFINSSVSISSTPSSPRLLVSFKNGELTKKNSEKCLFFLTSSQEEEESSSSTLVANLDMTMASMDTYFYTRCASLNGFICLSHKGRFMICNPSTRQVITLPEIADAKWKSTYKYFGYDPVDDQYKAMCKSISNSEHDQHHMVLTLGGDKELSWRPIEGTTRNYYPITMGICINGFVYYGAWTSTSIPSREPVIVCFDVRSERVSFIKPPFYSMVEFESTSTLINYKGKLALINLVTYEFSFVLHILEDVKEHEWSRKTFSFPISRHYGWLEFFGEYPMSFHSTNKRGEFVISPKFLPRDRIFYILYFDLENRNTRHIQLQGIADDEDFRSRYGIGENGKCQVYISPDYGGNFVFL